MSASEILESYARDWDIDQTPSSVKSAAVDNLLAPAIAAATSVRESLLKIFEVLPDLRVAVTGDQPTLDPFAGLFTSTLHLLTAPHLPAERWTWAALECHEQAKRQLVRNVRSLENTGYSVVQPSRADRALKAVAELSDWLGMTEAKAADVAGGYRRSYYNWVKGVQPYPATTLNLFEAHAFVSALVDSLDVRGAREWFAVEGASRSRLALLGDPAGRAELSRLASKILFRTVEAPSWAPDDDLRHSASEGRRHGSETSTRRPIKPLPARPTRKRSQP